MAHTPQELAKKLADTLVSNVTVAPLPFKGEEGESLYYFYVNDTCTEWCKKALNALRDKGEHAVIRIPASITGSVPYVGIVISILSTDDSETNKAKAILAKSAGPVKSSDFKTGSSSDIEKLTKEVPLDKIDLEEDETWESVELTAEEPKDDNPF